MSESLGGVGETALGAAMMRAAESTLGFEDDRADGDTPLSQARKLTEMGDIALLWQGGLREPSLAWLAKRGWHTESTIAPRSAAPTRVPSRTDSVVATSSRREPTTASAR